MQTHCTKISANQTGNPVAPDAANQLSASAGSGPTPRTDLERENARLRDALSEIRDGLRMDGRVWTKCEDDPSCREPGPSLKDFIAQYLNP